MREKAKKVKEKASQVKAKVKEKMPEHILFKIVFLSMGMLLLVVNSLF